MRYNAKSTLLSLLSLGYLDTVYQSITVPFGPSKSSFRGFSGAFFSHLHGPRDRKKKYFSRSTLVLAHVGPGTVFRKWIDAGDEGNDMGVRFMQRCDQSKISFARVGGADKVRRENKNDIPDSRNDEKSRKSRLTAAAVTWTLKSLTGSYLAKWAKIYWNSLQTWGCISLDQLQGN